MTAVKAEARAMRREARHEEILSAAAAMFAEKGFRDTTVQEIARELQMTGAAIYYYFDSKDQLLYEIWQRAGRKLQEGADAARALPGTAVDRLRAAMRNHLDVIISNRAIFEVLILQRSQLPEFGRELLIQDERVYASTIVDLIADIPDQQLRLKEPRILALGLIAMLNGVIRWYDPDQRLTLREIADFYFDMFASGALNPAE